MKHLPISLFIVILFLTSCSSDNDRREASLDEINIHMTRDPQRINPFYAPSAIGREIFQYIFLPLADFHPDDLELEPILITEIPARIEASDSTVAYDIEFREEAQWSDGTPVTAKDYVFTLKAISHPLGKAAAWKPYFALFKDVEEDAGNPRKFRVHVDKDYMLSKELALTTSLMPAHVYDPENQLGDIELGDLSDPSLEQDSSHIALFERINGAMNEKTGVVQTGPYTLTSFENEQYYVLERIDDYWGSAYGDNPFLQAHADKLVFRIVPDEVTAISMAREGKLDLLTLATSNTFLELRDDSTFAENWTFHTPQLFMYYFIALNNRSGPLADVNVRKALAHLVDVEDYIENVDGGLGVRTVGHFHPARSYYNDALEPVAYNPEHAKSLLAQAGWQDSDGDGRIDKIIDGKKTNLELELLMTGSNLSRNMALLLQESLGSVGIGMEIISKRSSVMRKENLENFNYDMAMLAVGQDAAPDDPYARWHSKAGGNNVSGYSNPAADSLIEQIRQSTDVNVRNQYYKALQKVMYEDQPVIFLYCPLKKIVINKRLDAVTTPKRPGYLANTFTAAE